MDDRDERKSTHKTFLMGNDRHISKYSTKLNFFGQEHVFYIVPNDFPLPEGGIIGIKFFEKYPRYAITNSHLVLNKVKLPLHLSNDFIPGKSEKICTISTDAEDQDIIIIDDKEIPDGLYTIRNGQIKIPLKNNEDYPKEVNLQISYEPILKIITNESNGPQMTFRLNELLKASRLDHLEKDQREFIKKMIARYSEVFTLESDPLPCTNLTEHQIVLKNGKIINLRSHKLPEKHRQFALEETEKLLKKGIIRESQSPYNSPLWIVPKKGNKLRMVIDYRKINEDTDQDAYPLPMIDDILDHLGKAKFFSAFDLSAGFHQIPMKEEDKKYTAFSTTQGHFEYNRMPFGLKNAPATFQRMMDNAFRGLIGTKCFAYIDDIVIFGSSIQEHNENLVAVMERIYQLGLRLEPKKCEYLKPELEYLGHIITKEGVKPNPEKINCIKEFRPLKTVKDVQSFLGLAGYYRKFIKNFSTIARPLTKLTQKETIFDWTPDCEKAFYDLKNALVIAPVLKFPDFSKQFILTTDASNCGLGAVLSQDGHPCLFISRTLNKAEEKYTTSEKELLAIVWAMKRLRQYLLGKKFKIQTDHRALVWLHNVKDPSSRLLRWRLRMEEYEYEIEYVKGKENKVADCLSRLFPITKDTLQEAMEKTGISTEEEEPSLEDQSPEIETFDKPRITKDEILKEKIKLTARRMREPSENETTETEEEITETPGDNTNLYTDFINWKLQPVKGKIKTKPNAIGKLWKEVTKDEMPMYNEEDWLYKLSWFIEEFVNRKLSIVRLSFGDPLFTFLEREVIQEIMEFLSNYYPDKNFHICFSTTRELTKEERKQIIKEAHRDHTGEQNTIEKAKRIGIWTNMDQDIKDYVKKCPICQLQKTTRIKNQSESIIPDIPLNPNDKIALDIFGPLPTTPRGNKYILSIQDRLTRYTTLIPLESETSTAIVEALIEQYIYIYGSPKTILTDQGSNFLSELMDQFEKALKIKHIKTTAFHPQSNGNIERMHSTLNNLIKTSMAENQNNWDENLKYVTFAINSTVNQTTGFTPFELTFGRLPNIPSQIENSPNLTHQDLIRKWRKKHEENIRKAKERIQVELEKTKKRLDEGITRTHPLYKPGNLVKILNDTKQNKLEQSWKGPYEVIDYLDNNNLRIRNKDKILRVHIDQCMPYFLDEDPSTSNSGNGQL